MNKPGVSLHRGFLIVVHHFHLFHCIKVTSSLLSLESGPAWAPLAFQVPHFDWISNVHPKHHDSYQVLIEPLATSQYWELPAISLDRRS